MIIRSDGTKVETPEINGSTNAQIASAEAAVEIANALWAIHKALTDTGVEVNVANGIEMSYGGNHPLPISINGAVKTLAQ